MGSKKIDSILFSIVSFFGLCLITPTQTLALSITSPQIYDCQGNTLNGITVSNTKDVIIKNCKISGATSTGIKIANSNNVTVQNVYITKVGSLSGAISFDNASNITIEDFEFVGGGSMGWGFSGPVNGITIRRGTITGSGQADSVYTHGMYIDHWDNFTIEDVVIDDAYNMGIKMVEHVHDGVLRNITIKNSGVRSNGTGNGIGMGEGPRSSDIQRIKIENCLMVNNRGPAIYGYNNTATDNKVSNVTINHCTFINNYSGVTMNSGATNWVVKNNITIQDQSVAGTSSNRVALFLAGGDSDISNNTFNYNLWRLTNGSTTLNPIRVNSTNYSLLSWKAKPSSPDTNSTSDNPNLDSGYRLTSNSPLCKGGENGTYLGSFPCGSSSPTSTPSPTPIPKPGDSKGDRLVDGIDYVRWGLGRTKYLAGLPISGVSDGDFNNDQKVDGVDYTTWALNYGK